MIAMQINFHVKPERVDDFVKATLENARGSRAEAGCVRFDLFQRNDDPNRYVLIEVFQSAEAQSEHFASPHFKVWKEAVDGAFVDTASQALTPVFPD